MGFERRGLRPFEVMHETQSLLNQKLRVQSPRIPDGYQPPLGNLGLDTHGLSNPVNGAIAAPGGTLVLDVDQYSTNTIGLYFGLSDVTWAEILRVVEADIKLIFGQVIRPPVNLIVTLTNSRLRMSQVVLEESLEKWKQRDGGWRVDLVRAGRGPDRPRPLRMPGDGCSITIQFVLGSDLPKESRAPGRPWRKGTWLARWKVMVVASGGSGLAPRPLTKEVRNRFGLGDECTSFVHLHGDQSGICMTGDLGEILAVYIDEEVLRSASNIAPNGEPKFPASNPLLNRIVMDTYRALVFAIHADDELKDFDSEEDHFKRTFTYHLLAKVAEYADTTEAEALNILKEQPNRFVALLEGSLDLRSSDGRLLELKAR